MQAHSAPRRGMGSVRGYPPLPITDREEQVPDGTVIGHAVIASVIIDSSNVFFEKNEQVSSSDLALIKTAVQSIFSDIVGADLILDVLNFHDFLAWHIELRTGREILRYGISYEVSSDLLQAVDAAIRKALDLELQFYVSSVYPLEDDISLALDEVTAMYEHALLLGVSMQVVSYRSGYPGQPLETDTDFSERKLDLEKLFFNAVITRDFQRADMLMNQLIDLELEVPEMAHSIRYMVSNRLAWIIYVLGTPSQTGSPLKKNLMADIAALDAIDNFAEYRSRISEIFRSFEEDYSVPPDSDTRFDRILDYIETNFRDCNLSGSEICTQFGISAAYLSRMFRKNTGSTMLDYIHKTRLAEVKRLLIESSRNVQDIAQECGYFSAWTMSRAFKKYEGITPGEYRKSAG